MSAGDTGTDYVVIHLVCQEADKDLIGPQVMDHASSHLSSDEAGGPSDVLVGFLEPLRHAITSRIRSRVRQHAHRAPEVKSVLLPYVSRIGIRNNVAVLALRLSRIVGGRSLVFHCRGESAVEWAIEFQAHFPNSAIVADIRGAWPEELLFARGFDSLTEADSATKQSYARAIEIARSATARAHEIFSVSPGLLGWLREIGVPDEKLTYVPCCVTKVAANRSLRAAMRDRLGLKDRLVLCYAGTITRYQHIADGVLPFFRAAAAADPNLHLLCVTPQIESFRRLIMESGISADRVTLVSASQRDVVSYLAAADAGLLLRAPGLLTNLSQPTKFAEYLSAGLPVIISHGVGDLASRVAAARAGTAVTLFGLSESDFANESRAACIALRENQEIWRKNALELCEREFMWSCYVTRVREAYLRALQEATTPREPPILVS
jgi:glycosyltransferase involved in cell wall biosynthesis